MGFLEGKNIVLGVTGSVAAFKAAEIASLLVKEGAEVRAVMTREAEEFIAPLTLKTLTRRPVVRSLWDENAPWKPEHIALAEWADLLLVAPATAHAVACFAHGLAPDALTCAYLATRVPVVIAPAMNEATQANLETLRERGNIVVEPAEGRLACGVSGKGRLADPAEIVGRVADILG